MVLKEGNVFGHSHARSMLLEFICGSWLSCGTELICSLVYFIPIKDAVLVSVVLVMVKVNVDI